MLSTDWECFLSSLEMSYRSIDENFYKRVNIDFLPMSTNEASQKFLSMLDSFESITSKEEFIKSMR